MKKYKVVSSTIDYLNNIEFDFDFSTYCIGDEIILFGVTFRINQTGAGIIGVSNSKSVLVVQEIINIK